MGVAGREGLWSAVKRIVAGALMCVAVSGLTGCTGIGKSEPVKTGNITMPNLVGKNGAVAKDDLERIGFDSSRIKLAPGDGHVLTVMPSHWSVTAQSEQPGAVVSLQELIVLTVRKN